MKNPAIHITLSDLETVLAKARITAYKHIAELIFKYAAPYNIKNRYIIQGNKVVIKKAERILKVAEKQAMTVERFNLLLTYSRKELGHRFITPIHKGDNNYLTLQEVHKLACEFSEACGIDTIDEGCKQYISIGIQKMRSKFALNKFKYHNSAIYQYYESLDTIKNDPKPKRTKRFHGLYTSLLLEYHNVERTFTEVEDYVCFIYARMDAEKEEANTTDWIVAQFEEVQRMFDEVPSVRHLFGSNAKDRYYNYMVLQGTKVETESIKAKVVEAAPATFMEKYYQRKAKRETE